MNIWKSNACLLTCNIIVLFLLRSSLPPLTLMSRALGTAFSSDFKAPFTLSEGLHRTLHYEFIDSEKDEVVF